MQNRFKLLTITLVSILFLFNCSDPTSPNNNSVIWPLKPGNEWLFNIIEPDWITEKFKRHIIDTLIVNFEGENYTVSKSTFHFENEPQPEYQWLYWNGPDGIYFMGGISPKDTFLVKSLQLKYPAQKGDSWQTMHLEYDGYNQKFLVSEHIEYKLIDNNFYLETPAGNFNCYVYEYISRPVPDQSLKWHYRFYYSPDIGLVHHETLSEEGFDVKYKYTLSSYISKKLR